MEHFGMKEIYQMQNKTKKNSNSILYLERKKCDCFSTHTQFEGVEKLKY